MGTLIIYGWRRLGVGPKKFDWTLKADNGKPIASSHRQGYNDESEAERMARQVIGGKYSNAGVVRRG